MTACSSHLRTPALPTPALRVFARAAISFALLALGAALSGCAGMSEGMTEGFADPAKYELYDCKQLEAERKSLAKRETDLQGLMAKADTGTAGPLVAELAYRNELISVRGQRHFADEAWRKSKCRETPPGAVATTPPGTAPFKPTPAPSRSGDAAH